MILKGKTAVVTGGSRGSEKLLLKSSLQRAQTYTLSAEAKEICTENLSKKQKRKKLSLSG